MIDVSVNGKGHRADVEPDTPLLWVIRDAIGLPGTKFDYGMALCGAFTVQVQCSLKVTPAIGSARRLVTYRPTRGRPDRRSESAQCASITCSLQRRPYARRSTIGPVRSNPPGLPLGHRRDRVRCGHCGVGTGARGQRGCAGWIARGNAGWDYRECGSDNAAH